MTAPCYQRSDSLKVNCPTVYGQLSESAHSWKLDRQLSDSRLSTRQTICAQMVTLFGCWLLDRLCPDCQLLDS